MRFRSLLAPASLLFLTVQAHALETTPENDTQPAAPVEYRLVPRFAFSDTEKSSSPLNAALQDDLWERMRSGFQMQALDAQLVKEHENWVVNRPDYLKRVTSRARRYMYYIVDALEKRGMPTELALLPIVESAYNPTAYSPAHASGLWQFIPSTGKTYGLEQTWWYDGRRDVVAATDAAINYFQYLYGLFGDWNLVLASYNWGEGAVARAVQKNRDKGLPTDFMSLNMPAETRNYVPKLMALKNIVSNPGAYGLKLDPIPNRPYFVTVAPNRHIDTKLAAQLADMSVQDFTDLNPAYTKPVIASKDTRRILVPVDKADSFLNRLATYDKPTLSWQAYGTRKGESLTDIAQGHGISVEELRQFNKLPSKAKVATGQILLVPITDDGNNLLATAGAPTLASPVPLKNNRKLSLRPSLVPDAEGQTPAVVALVEQKQAPAPIEVKTAPAAKVAVAPVAPVKVEKETTPATTSITVAKIEKTATVVDVAPVKETSVVQIAVKPASNEPAVNPVVVANTTVKPEAVVVEKPVVAKAATEEQIAMLQLDQRELPVTKQKVAESRATVTKEKAPIVYTVAKGDTLYNIAKRYNMTTDELIKLNKLGGHGIRLGQVLKVDGESNVAATTAIVKADPADRRSTSDKIVSAKGKNANEADNRHGNKDKSTLYTVKQGDTLYSIARKYKVTPVELKKWNDNPKVLQPGDKVKVIVTQG